MSSSKEFLVSSLEVKENSNFLVDSDKKEVEEIVTNQLPIFFRIRRNNRISYVLGTNHVLPFSILHPKCQEIIKKANCLATESNEHADIDRYRLEGEPSWLAYLPEQFVDFLKQKRKIMEVEDLSFDALVLLASLGKNLDGMDAYIMDYFEENTRKVYVLDSNHMELADKVYTGSMETSCEAIKTIIKTMSKLKKNQQQNKDILKTYEGILETYGDILRSFIQNTFIQALTDINDNHKKYCEGDITLDEDENEDEAETYLQLGERNYKWLPKILELHQKQDQVVFAFGLGHLDGKYGILNLLYEGGFKIERMNNRGIFESFRNDKREGTLAERLLLQREVYDTFSNQILDSSTDDSLSWMREAYNDQIKWGQWERWQQQYNKKHQSFRNNETNGYGAGALVVYSKRKS